MDLTEHKTETIHFFTDKQGRKQGEYRTWHENGQPWGYCFFVDDKKQGEYSLWHDNGQPWGHYFYVDGKKVIDFLEEPDKYPKTPEERTWFALKYGSGGWLSNLKATPGII